MTDFFVPRPEGVSGGDEKAYAAIREAVGAEQGRPPRQRRIHKLYTRRSAVDCESEVGKPDPVSGDLVLAILDLGHGRPYVICCGAPGAEAAPTSLLVDHRVYEITEFAS